MHCLLLSVFHTTVRTQLSTLNLFIEQGEYGKGKKGSDTVVVKFTLTYNSTVHKHLYEHGMAPQLMTEEQMCDR